jgi:hypothetical protein
MYRLLHIVRHNGVLKKKKIFLANLKHDGPPIKPQKPKTPVAETSAPTTPISASVGHPMMSKAARPAVPPDFDGDR